MSNVELTPAEQKVYEKVCNGDVMCKQLPPRESGAVPGLVRKSIVEIYKRTLSPRKGKKFKFLRLKT